MASSASSSGTARSIASQRTHRRPARPSWSCSVTCSGRTSFARHTSLPAIAAAPTGSAARPTDDPRDARITVRSRGGVGVTSYDRIDWHLDSAIAAGQPEENAFAHIGLYLAWLIRHDLHDP